MLAPLTKSALVLALITGAGAAGFAAAAPETGAPQPLAERVAAGAATLMMKGIAAGYTAKVGEATEAAQASSGAVLLQVNFTVTGDTAAFEAKMQDFAPFLSHVPGLTWKVWSFDPATRMGNGTYLFASQRDLDMYLSEMLPVGMGGDPQVQDIETRVLPVLSVPSRLTHAAL